MLVVWCQYQTLLRHKLIFYFRIAPNNIDTIGFLYSTFCFDLPDLDDILVAIIISGVGCKSWVTFSGHI